MPILGDRIFHELDQERVICITGYLSGGKTRLAFDLALPYWRKGFRVISNTLHNFSHKWKKDPPELYNSFIVADEGGEYVRTEKVSSLITRSAGKANYYVVFAGKRLPHKLLQGIVIKQRFNFFENFGIPLILWRATVNSDDKYKFPVWQWYPQKLHGTYSTRSSSGSLEEIFARAGSTVDHLARVEGQTAGKQAEAGMDGLADDIAGSFGFSSQDFSGA